MTRAGRPKTDPDDATLIASDVRVLQLVPAQPGWWARWRDPADNPDDEWVSPVVAWALTLTRDGNQKIVGVDPSGGEFHMYGDVIDQEVVYFYSADPPEGALGVGDPGPRAPGKA